MFTIRSTTHAVTATLACLVIVQALPASAADMPKRKAGLWEINTQMAGQPSHGGIQQCIDSNTDNIMQQRAAKMDYKCSVMDMKRQGDKTLMHSVCLIDKTTATTDAVITGNFNSGYRNEMTIRYDPPMMGMSTAKMTQEAKWLGPCKPGQKPGDIIMPGLGNINMQDMEKTQKQMEEMMKRQQGR